jgi:hypothetical protein
VPEIAAVTQVRHIAQVNRMVRLVSRERFRFGLGQKPLSLSTISSFAVFYDGIHLVSLSGVSAMFGVRTAFLIARLRLRRPFGRLLIQIPW